MAYKSAFIVSLGEWKTIPRLQAKISVCQMRRKGFKDSAVLRMLIGLQSFAAIGVL